MCFHMGLFLWHPFNFIISYIVMKLYQNRNLIVKGESQNVGNLWLGDFQSARNKKGLRNDNISAVVTAGLGMKISYTSEIKHKMLPLYDSEAENIIRFFDSTFQFIDEALKNGNVLIHCYAGISRSTTILAAYLMRKNKWSCRQTLAMIKKSRFVIGPNKGFMNQLRKFESGLNSDNYSSKMEQSTSSATNQSSVAEGKPNKNFVDGFLSYKRDTSLFQKYKDGNNKGDRSKTVGKGMAKV